MRWWRGRRTVRVVIVITVILVQVTFGLNLGTGIWFSGGWGSRRDGRHGARDHRFGARHDRTVNVQRRWRRRRGRTGRNHDRLGAAGHRRAGGRRRRRHLDGGRARVVGGGRRCDMMGEGGCSGGYWALTGFDTNKGPSIDVFWTRLHRTRTVGRVVSIHIRVTRVALPTGPGPRTSVPRVRIRLRTGIVLEVLRGRTLGWPGRH
uniref:(northern house mosquito) hypothetical protein n=1 Tax=Culex pipiens TaxID=7175 RepID=A0A8D8GYA8_CULPI